MGRGDNTISPSKKIHNFSQIFFKDLFYWVERGGFYQVILKPNWNNIATIKSVI